MEPFSLSNEPMSVACGETGIFFKAWGMIPGVGKAESIRHHPRC